jgi:NADH-quinone oxidoreductase subunit M
MNILFAAQAGDAAGAAGGWLLPAMVLLPLVCGFGIVLLPQGREELVRRFALAVTGLVFLMSLVTAVAFDFGAAAAAEGGWSAAFQLTSAAPWVPQFGVRFAFGVDTVSLWLVLLTAFLAPLTILGTWDDAHDRVKEFYLWLLVLQGALIGVFTALDVLLFYIFFEMTLVPLFFLIGIFGSGNRLYAATKFVVFTLAGSLLTLAGVVYVAWFNYTVTGEWSFAIPQLLATAQSMSATEQAWVFGALIAGFAIKVPLVPVHTWLPLAHTEAPTAGSVVLAGVLLKLGSYGLYRFALPMAPEAVVAYAPAVAVLAIIGILYTALICWVQTDFKKLVAYSSVSHMGFCILGMFALNMEGLGGSVMYMINHGLSTGALFLCVGMVYHRYHTREMEHFSGLGRRMPVWSTFLVIFALASVGLPGLNGFVGEFLTLLGAFTANEPLPLGIWYAAVAAVGLIFAAIYILYMVGRLVLGPVRVPQKYDPHVSDLNWREITSLAPIAVACLVLGLYPTPVLKSFESSIARTRAPVQAVLDGAAQPGGAETVESEQQPSEASAAMPEPAEPAMSGAGAGKAASVLHGSASPVGRTHVPMTLRHDPWNEPAVRAAEELNR